MENDNGSVVNTIYKNYIDCLKTKIAEYKKSSTTNDAKKKIIYEITHSHPMTFDQFSRIDYILRTQHGPQEIAARYFETREN